MKKKIISILLAITFVLSFAIVPSMAEALSQSSFWRIKPTS